MLQLRAEGNGLTSSDIPEGSTVYMITAFISLALYNVIELNGFIFTTFKKRNGLYFWSMLVATWGVALNAIGYLLKFLLPGSSSGLQALYTVFVLVGWSSMITGQSVVLFSRLHLLVHDRFTIRLVLTMIVVDAFICHPPTFALFSLTNNQNNTRNFSVAYSIFEKFQLFVFFIQEFIISSVYIRDSWRFLRSRTAIVPNSGRTGAGGDRSLTDRSRMVIYWLIGINVLVVVLDISILVLEFSGLYDLQTSWVRLSRHGEHQTKHCPYLWSPHFAVACQMNSPLTAQPQQKAFVYSVKLKLEFSILNKLIGVVKARTSHQYILPPFHTLYAFLMAQ